MPGLHLGVCVIERERVCVFRLSGGTVPVA